MHYYKNLDRVNLLSFKEKYPELNLAFKFLEELSNKIKKNSFKKNITTDTVIFINYFDNNEYNISINVVNEILKQVYYDSFFKVILSDCYNSNIFFWVYDYYDVFFKNLFIALKNAFERKIKLTHNFLVAAIVNLSKNFFGQNKQNYIKFCENIRNTIKFLDLNVLNQQYSEYFFLSYETFSFCKTDDGCHYSRYRVYFDLEDFLLGKKYFNIVGLARIDFALQIMILSSFKNAKYLMKRKLNTKYEYYYTDNSYIKSRIDSNKVIPEIEKCQLFNNL